jgi:DNA topoisomerase-2
MPTKKSTGKKSTEMTIEQIYKHKTPHEHILSEPDTYVSSIAPDDINMWVFDDATERFEYRNINIPPGLYKIFDEILVNTRDHTVRDKTCKNIKISLDKDSGRITVWNDGKGIPVEMHKEFHAYVPEMIFGNLRTSSNYDTKGKIVGGKNGFGAKLTNIFSTEFILETVDSDRQKFYRQVFKNNMYDKSEPEIKSSKANSYTSISFVPDFKRFQIKGLTKDIIALFEKRVYDIAACTDKNVSVYLNDKIIKFKDYTDYIAMYYESKPAGMAYAHINTRWKVCAVYDSDCGFNQVSFVNGILTFNGGTHVNYIMDQIVDRLTEVIHKKQKDLHVKADQIKTNITLFVDSIVEDPSFTSQIKDSLSTKKTNFGSKCELTDEFITTLSKTGIIDEVIRVAQFKEQSLLKKTDGKKSKKISEDKLEDALWAGGPKSDKTLLILTEGDSAKAFALSGLEIIGNERYGVFPLRGKLLNVRDASTTQINLNKEFIALKRILGLKQGVNYKTTKELRYGGILILTDQDVDGSHIKGLIINMLHCFWPSLIVRDDFIKALRTPLLKAYKKTDKKKTDPKIFYSNIEYKNWVEDELHGDTSKWDIKYYKGLGTSKDKEAKEAFVDFENKIINYVCDTATQKDDELDDISENESDDDSDNGKKDNASSVNVSNVTDEAINLAFAKNKADARKAWLMKYDPNDTLGDENVITYSQFINKELIVFSTADNVRSIPSGMDGLKPSLRKILYACIMRGVRAGEIKVSQLAGYVSQHTEYHHGEASLMGAIIGMAQNYPGSNNINYLIPSGQFGYRRMLGKECASPRYIFTDLNPLMAKIFRKEDMPILNYQKEENMTIEPDMYAPIIPMVLVNGTEGIGTGFSTTIPPFNPEDIVKHLMNIIDEKPNGSLHPWFRGFKGRITPENTELSKYIMSGVYEIVDEQTVHVTEIPIYISLDNYKHFLETLEIKDKKDNASVKKKILSFDMKPYNNTVDITITFKPTELQKLMKAGGLEKYLKLNTTIAMTNMNLYNAKGKITKYDEPSEILEDFYAFRYGFYEKRKAYMIKLLENELNILKYKVKYINDILDKKIIVERKKKDVVLERLHELKYPKLSTNINATDADKSYDYLTSMLLFSLTDEKIDEHKKEMEEKQQELDLYRNTPIATIWKSELNEFLSAYKVWLKELEDEESVDVVGKKPGKKTSKTSKTTKTTKTNPDETPKKIVKKARPSTK